MTTLKDLDKALRMFEGLEQLRQASQTSRCDSYSPAHLSKPLDAMSALGVKLTNEVAAQVGFVRGQE